MSMSGASRTDVVESYVTNKYTGGACNTPVYDQRPVIASTYYCITQVALTPQERPFCMDTKKCSKCGEVKECSAFSKSPRRKDGLRPECKACDAAYRAEHSDVIAAYLAENRERIVERRAAYNAAHRAENAARWESYYAEHRDDILARQAKYRDEHRAEIAAYGIAYHVTHREEKAIRHASWAKANSEKVRAITHRRRARTRGVGGTHTAEDIKRQLAVQNGKCWWCNKPCADKYHEDHLIPLSRGGHNDITNIVISCPTCNLKKHNKTPDEFAGRLL